MPNMLRVKFLVDVGDFKKGDIAVYPEPLVKLAPEKFEVDPVEPVVEAPKPAPKKK
jgi:hypothetical protein